MIVLNPQALTHNAVARVAARLRSPLTPVLLRVRNLR